MTESDPVRKGQTLARFDTTELSVNLEQAEARLALAEASVAENRATHEDSWLAKVVINAPIDGLVLEGAVEPGSTVAASSRRQRSFCWPKTTGAWSCASPATKRT